MIEQELQQKLIEVSSELNIARQNMAQIKKSLVQAESIIIDLKLLQERLTEELYALSESTPVKEKTEYNDLVLKDFREQHADVCKFASDRDNALRAKTK